MEMERLLMYPQKVDQATDGWHDYHQVTTNFQGPSLYLLEKIA